jgi:hypothetical protein
LKNLRLLSQVRRRRVAAWTRLCPAGALAIGGFGRSRWRGGRGGSYGFCMRDSRFVRLRVGLSGLVKDVGESVGRSEEAMRCG